MSDMGIVKGFISGLLLGLLVSLAVLYLFYGDLQEHRGVIAQQKETITILERSNFRMSNAFNDAFNCTENDDQNKTTGD
jgi:hypothetical protein